MAVNPSTIISIIYSTLYGTVIIATSIYCLWELKQKANSSNPTKTESSPQNDNTTSSPDQTQTASSQPKGQHDDAQSHVYDGNFFKDWLKSIWHKKKIYWAIIPHIFDQATDAGVIYEYHTAWTQYDESDANEKNVNPYWFFVFGIAIIVLQRVISTITIYAMTHNPRAAVLQFFDLLMVKAIWINYVFGLDEPCNPQRYIELLEACFESSPQIILSTGYILKSLADGADGQTIPDIVIISTAFSLWSLTAKVAKDDRILFSDPDYEYRKPFRNLDFKFKKRFCCVQFNWQYLVRVILWRFLEISGRVCLCVLIWINIGGFALVVILGCELMICFIFCVVEKTPDAMGNIMYISFGTKKGYVRWFWIYRVLFFYVYIIMVTVFAAEPFDAPKIRIPDSDTRKDITLKTTLGLFMLVYTWIAGCIWPYVVLAMAKADIIDDHILNLGRDIDTDDAFSTSRDLISYVWNDQCDEVRQLLKFGYVVQDDYVDFAGYTLLHAACSYGDMEFFKLCYQTNTKNINKANDDGNQPLHWLMRSRLKAASIEKVEFLLKHGADINALNNDGQTPLTYAASRGHESLEDKMRYIIQKGADISIVAKNGKTALDYCIENRPEKWKELIALLKGHKIDNNIDENDDLKAI
eukprot:489251_1